MISQQHWVCVVLDHQHIHRKYQIHILTALITKDVTVTVEEVFRGTYVRFWAVFGHKRHPEVGAEEGPGEPASSFPRGQFLPHHDGSLEDTLTYVCGQNTKSSWA